MKHVTGNSLEPQPPCEFRVSKLQPGLFLDASRLAMTPREAARHNPNAFLRFAVEVYEEALRVRAEQSQLELDLCPSQS